MNRFTQQKPISKSVLSILVPVVVFFAVFFLFLLPVSSISATTKQEEIENLKQAVIRSTIYCYAVEGTYPESLSYLENYYGITYDHSKYLISYEVHASNLMPDIDVIFLTNKGELPCVK